MPRLWSQVVTVAVVVGVVAAFGLPVLLDVVRPASEVVTEALTQAANGHASAIVGVFTQKATADPLGKAPLGSGFVAPSDIRVVRVVKDGHNDAAVDVSYLFGKARRTESVNVTRTGWFAPWRIDAVPAVLHVETPWPVRVRVAGVATESGVVTVAPGAYRVEADHQLLTTVAKTASVGLAGGYVELEPKLRKNADDAASKTVNAVIDECAASKDRLTVQSQCPFIETRPRVLEPESVTWEVTDYPDIRLELDNGEFIVDTTKHGEAVLTLDFEDRKSTAYTCRFNVDGPLEVTGTAMAWSGNPVKNLDGCKKGNGS